MCGIAGQLNLDNSPVFPLELQKMTDSIAHRGPDGEGQWIENNVGFGHRRLSIIDLSPAGQQPMISSDHRYVLTFNGEIYNFKELRTELEAEGYWFRSKSDTEVVMYALSAWGVEALRRFNGMFALGFWDRQKQSLLLARDRYGIKPLYYSQSSTELLFASEQKAITANSRFKKELDEDGLREYLTFQNIFTEKTLLKNMNLLPAGHFQEISLTGDRQLRSHCYWDYHFSEPTESIPDEEYIEELDRLFTQAVNRQLVSDVELGSYLSGGMDSGSITAIASKSIPNIKSFTCGFDLSSASGIELGFDERVKAEAMSALFKTEHYEMVLKSGDMERCLPRLANHLEEPRVGQSYPNYYAAQLASKFVKVVLSGAGGDELFGGYPWRYYRAAHCTDFDHYVDSYHSYWQRMLDEQEFNALLSPLQGRGNGVSTKQIFRDVFHTYDTSLDRPEDYINNSLYFEAKTFLHGLFVVEDKLSMAHSLETRVPFMDNDLVDFSMRVPVSLKLNNLHDVVRINENEPGNKQQNYFQKSSDGKTILRKMMTRYIPDEIVKAQKQGFSSPDSSWFKGESMQFVRNKLLIKETRISTILNNDVIEKLVSDHLDGKQNRRLLIWSLLNLEEWLTQNLD